MRFTAYILMLLTIAVYGCKKDILDLDLTDHQQERIIGEGMITQHFKKQRFFFSLSSNLGDVNQTVTNEANLLIKTPAEVTSILNNIPFENIDYSKLYFTLLNEIPQSALIDKLKEFSFPPEEYVINGTSIYFYSPNGYGRAKMNNNFFENT